MRDFTFHAKRGQHDQVAELLEAYLAPMVRGRDYYTRYSVKPILNKTPEGVMVTVKLPEGVSKNSVNKMLWRAGVPGASSRRKHTPWVKIKRLHLDNYGRVQYTGDQSQLRELANNGFYEKPVLVSVDGKIRKLVITHCVDCLIVMQYSELSPSDKRVHRMYARRAAAARKVAEC